MIEIFGDGDDEADVETIAVSLGEQGLVEDLFDQ